MQNDGNSIETVDTILSSKATETLLTALDDHRTILVEESNDFEDMILYHDPRTATDRPLIDVVTDIINRAAAHLETLIIDGEGSGTPWTFSRWEWAAIDEALCNRHEILSKAMLQDFDDKDVEVFIRRHAQIEICRVVDVTNCHMQALGANENNFPIWVC